MDSEKIYVDRDGMSPADMIALLQSNKGMDPMAMMAMMQNQGGLGGNNGLLWIFLLLLFKGGFGGLGSGAGQEAFDTNVLLRAIDGNQAAINQLSTTLNCDMGQVNTALCSIRGGIDKLGGEIGYSSERVINSIQHGNCDIISKLQECCCENRLAILNQTNVMQAGFTAIGNSLSKGFCDIAYAAQTNTRDIIENNNYNTQRIIDNLNAQAISVKDQRIAQLESEKQTAEIIAACKASATK